MAKPYATKVPDSRQGMPSRLRHGLYQNHVPAFKVGLFLLQSPLSRDHFSQAVQLPGNALTPIKSPSESAAQRWDQVARIMTSRTNTTHLTPAPRINRWRHLRLGLLAFCTLQAFASENLPHRPFAEWADLPAKGQFVVGLLYEESEAYHIWAGTERSLITYKKDGENYGIDINQGYLTLQYGIAKKWAFDLNVGYTTAAWRSFNTTGNAESTTGLMDIALGVRYQIVNEAETDIKWLPTITFRAGGILPGTFEKDFAFAPGLRSAGIEPEFLFRKHFGWPGFGAFGDVLYRWNKTTGTDQYMTSIGVFQQIKGWELDVGYRHMQTLSGEDIQYDSAAPQDIYYPRAPREINDAIEAGFSYTTSKRHFKYAFHTRTIFDGSNTDQKFWIGGSITMPFGGESKDKEKE
jgi:hypothetical protein